MTGSGYAIRARFEAQCPPGEVTRWLDSTEAISGWWSDTVTGNASEGESFTVRFPTTPVGFELDVRQSSNGVVEWHVPVNPPWWRGTTIRFEVGEGENGGSVLSFSHGGFAADDPIIPVITPAWVRFLDNLVAVAESGEPHPAVVN